MKPFIIFFITLLAFLIYCQGRSFNIDLDRNGYVSRRFRRYLGLSKAFKLNKSYQECVAPGDLQGHCKHAIFCPVDVLGSSKNSLDSLCVIEKTHIGVCCPDEVLLTKIKGSQVIMDLPAGGLDYSDSDSNTGCGLRTMAKSFESYSPVQKWPWISALYLPHQPYEQFCGGTLITDQHILTAAHCLEGLDPKIIRVRLGEYDFTKLKETRSKDFSLETMIVHEDYNSNTYENDIAILKMNSSTNFNSYMWPICLPPVNRSFEDEIAFVAGWGQIRYGGPTSELLLEVSVPIWNQQKCVESFAQRINENFLCAGAFEGGKDACRGDSGGPLLYQLDNGRWVIIGVVSWGIGCGDKGKPGIYTRVNKYLPWIIRNTISN